MTGRTRSLPSDSSEVLRLKRMRTSLQVFSDDSIASIDNLNQSEGSLMRHKLVVSAGILSTYEMCLAVLSAHLMRGLSRRRARQAAT